MTEDHFDAVLSRVRADYIWGAKGERLYLKHRQRLTPGINHRLGRLEHNGYCGTYGLLPVHAAIATAGVISNITISKLTGFDIGDFPQAWACAELGGAVTLYAGYLRKAPIRPSAVRQSTPGAVHRVRQLRHFAVGFAASLIFQTAAAEMAQTRHAACGKSLNLQCRTSSAPPAVPAYRPAVPR